MPGMRYQPQGRYTVASRYQPLIAAGFLPQAGGYASLGAAQLTPLARFSTVSAIEVTPFGYALTSNSASDNRGNVSYNSTSALRIEYGITRNRFTFMGVFRVRGVDGAGAASRAGRDDIFLWYRDGAYGLRVNNVSYMEGVMPLNGVMHYVVASGPEGLFLCVNGVEVIAAPAVTSSATLKNGVELYEDSLFGGGAMDLDVGLFALLSTGIGRAEARSLSGNLWQIFAEQDEEGGFVAPASHAAAVAAMPLSLDSGMVGMRVSRRVRVQPSALAATAGSIGARVTRRIRVQPAAAILAGGGIEIRYSPVVAPNVHTLPVSAGSMLLEAAAVQMRVRRRLLVQPANVVLTGREVQIELARRAGDIDLSAISPSRIVVFEGSGSRLIVFEGSGSRVVIFEGSGKRMRLNEMSAKFPVKIGERWTTDRDRDEISYYAADITEELADRNTTADPDSVTAPVFGVELLEGPTVQVAMIDGVQRTFVVVKLGGIDGILPDDWRWVARVPCMNGERFDKTTWFNEVDP